MQSWGLLQSSYRSEILPRKSIFYWAWRELHIAITCRERERESRIRGGLFQLGFLWMTRGASLSLCETRQQWTTCTLKKRCVGCTRPTIQHPCALANMTKRNSFFSFYLLYCVLLNAFLCVSLTTTLLSVPRCIENVCFLKWSNVLQWVILSTLMQWQALFISRFFRHVLGDRIHKKA